MKHIDVRSVPVDYKRAVHKDYQGSVIEESYRVNNYINAARLLETNQMIDSRDAGRDTIKGEAIIKPCNIYLPAGYDPKDKTTSYKVLYLLHGVGGDHYEWLRGSGTADGNYILSNILDNLIASGDIDPLIVVFPNGRSAHDWNDTTFNFAGTNMLGFYYFDYELRYDLIPFIESNFNTIANINDTSCAGVEYNRIHRAIAGLSMGGMQALNLIIGGFRCDSVEYMDANGDRKSELEATVSVPGMQDLFRYVGAFSNAPTSSEGKILGASLKSGSHKLDLLYMTCGDVDNISINFYEKSIQGLLELAEDRLDGFYQIVIKDGVHDFQVWNNGAFNFLRLSFQQHEEKRKPNVVRKTLSLT